MSDPKCLSVALIMKELVMMISEASGTAALVQGHFPLKTQKAVCGNVTITESSDSHALLKVKSIMTSCNGI